MFNENLIIENQSMKYYIAAEKLFDKLLINLIAVEKSFLHSMLKPFRAPDIPIDCGLIRRFPCIDIVAWKARLYSEGFSITYN